MNILSSAIAIAKAVTLLFGKNIEVVLHDIKANKIIHIENNLSGRKIGDSSLISEHELNKNFKNSNILGPYKKISSQGHVIKSISILLRSECIMMCINYNIEELSNMKRILEAMLEVDSKKDINSFIKSDWKEHTHFLLNNYLKVINNSLILLTRNQKIALIKQLDEELIFNYRGSSLYVANLLGISRANFYILLKESKEQLI
jgi:D-arginine utilization repressor